MRNLFRGKVDEEIAHEIQGGDFNRINAQACAAGTGAYFGSHFNQFDIFHVTSFVQESGNDRGKEGEKEGTGICALACREGAAGERQVNICKSSVAHLIVQM
jgi:hypothetical protein